MTNYDLSLHVFSFLQQAGVEELVICAGARNAPMVLALKEQKFKTFHFFEERSAAFFAMGLIKSSKKPVAVLTTSGTAAAELLPAAIESTYQGLPLILITADRPKVYRGSGAPQVIEQIGLFSHYVERVYDLDVQTSAFNFEWSFQKPIHLNVCYDEPLIDKASGSNVKLNLVKSELNPGPNEEIDLTKPLIIVGALEPEQIPLVIQYILETGAPVYAEALSHLKNVEKIKKYLISSSEHLIKKAFKLNLCDAIVRIGGVPTLRFWRDLESEFKNIPVVNYTDLSFSGLSRKNTIKNISELANAHHTFSKQDFEKIKAFDAELQKRKLTLFEKYPLSEPAFAFYFSNEVNEHAIYLGNSLPIRHWDQFAECRSTHIYANRGANGIDGQVSTYLGWSESQKKSYCFIGDLTALYDLAALGLTTQLKQAQRCIVIMNNYGGQIFNRVFNNSEFINSHTIQFQNWAQMWCWDYLQIHSLKDFKKLEALPSSNHVIELLPNYEQTQNFWAEWDQECKQI